MSFLSRGFLSCFLSFRRVSFMFLTVTAVPMTMPLQLLDAVLVEVQESFYLIHQVLGLADDRARIFGTLKLVDILVDELAHEGHVRFGLPSALQVREEIAEEHRFDLALVHLGPEAVKLDMAVRHVLDLQLQGDEREVDVREAAMELKGHADVPAVRRDLLLVRLDLFMIIVLLRPFVDEAEKLAILEIAFVPDLLVIDVQLPFHILKVGPLRHGASPCTPPC